jgi:hypothetical protein
MLNYTCTVYIEVRMKCAFMYVEPNKYKYILGNGHPAVLEPRARSNEVPNLLSLVTGVPVLSPPP